VDRVLVGHCAHEPSRSYADLASGNVSHLANIASTVEPTPGQVGVIAFVGGQVSCVDLFEAPEVLAGLWSGLIASYQAEALMAESTTSKAFGAKADAGARRGFR